MTSFHVQFFLGNLQFWDLFQPMFISENYPKFASEDWGYKIAKVDSCKLMELVTLPLCLFFQIYSHKN